MYSKINLIQFAIIIIILLIQNISRSLYYFFLYHIYTKILIYF